MAGGTLPILIELERGASIETLYLLHKLPGIAKIHLDFDQFGKKPRLKQLPAPGEMSELNGGSHRARRATSSKDGFSPSRALIEVIAANNGPMARADIRKLNNGERMANNITALKKAGKLRQVGPSLYDLTAEARRELNREAEATEASAVSGDENATGASLIISMLRKAEPLTRKDFASAFIANGRSPASVGDQLGKLAEQKLIKRHPKGPDYPRGGYVLV